MNVGIAPQNVPTHPPEGPEVPTPAHPERWATALGLTVALLLGAPARAADEIQVCQDSELRPPCVTLRHGVNDLGQWGLSNRISSFSMAAGNAWLMCTEPSFQGRCEVFSRNESDLRGSAFQDSISSLRPVRAPGSGGWDGADAGQRLALVVYEGTQYAGRSWVVTNDTPDLYALGVGRMARSVKALAGRWEICREPGYRSCFEVRGAIPDLMRVGFQDRVASVRELGPGSGPGGLPGVRGVATLYEDADYGGRSVVVTAASRDLSAMRFNDAVTAVRIEPGTQWELCMDADHRGRCVRIDRDVPNLRALGLNDEITSIKRLR